MRLTFGEIALNLGCGLNTVIWEEKSFVAPEASSMPEKAPTLSELARKNKGGRSCGCPSIPAPVGKDVHTMPWAAAPWVSRQPTGAAIDSRAVKKGNIFFCLTGEHSDGHEYALDAARAGAGAIVASRNPFWGVQDTRGLPPVFLVEDPLHALWRIAICHRDTSLARVTGITGTAGKTSVKEVLAQVLAVRGQTARNPMNFNNQIGLPVSMLNASADASFWVMEVGISEAHDMDELGTILRPDLAVILNVGDGHTSGLGKDGVAHNKALLLDYIMPRGTALVSGDYPELDRKAQERIPSFTKRGVELLRFSAAGKDGYCKAAYLGPGKETSGKFEVLYQGTHHILEAPFRGTLGSENVAAIVAAAGRLGLTMDEIKQGLSTAQLPDQRFACQECGKFVLVDDSYNANPLSSTRMIEAVQEMAQEMQKPLILVMGEMLELGEKAEAAHEALGKTMADASPELVFWVGDQIGSVSKGLLKGGFGRPLYPVSNHEEFEMLLTESGIKEGVVLFKGSRGNKMEHFVKAFRESMNTAGDTNAV